MADIVPTPQGFRIVDDNGMPVQGTRMYTTRDQALDQLTMLEYAGMVKPNPKTATAFKPQPVAAQAVVEQVKPAAKKAPAYVPPEELVDMDKLHADALARAEAVPGLLQDTGLLKKEEPTGNARLQFAIPAMYADLESKPSQMSLQRAMPGRPQAPAQFVRNYTIAHDLPSQLKDSTDPEDFLSHWDMTTRELHPEAGPITYDANDEQRGLRGPLGPVGYDYQEQKSASPAEKRAKTKEALTAPAKDAKTEAAVDSMLASSPFHSTGEGPTVRGRPEFLKAPVAQAPEQMAKPSFWERLLTARTISDLYDQ